MSDEQPKRHCSKCKALKPATLEFFGPHSRGRYGISPSCRACERARAAERNARQDQKARMSAWCAKNADALREAARERTREYRLRDPEAKRARAAEYVLSRYRCEPWFNLRVKVAARMRAMLAGKAGRRSADVLGYSREELMAHIERQFLPGMTWERVLSGEVHIDHIIPVASFKATSYDSPEFKACWALSNLRPMWADENKKKGSKVLTLL